MAKSEPTKPLKITAHLVDGRINSTDGIIMFDSVLYHAWFLKYAPEVIEGRRNEKFDGYIGLPLKRLPGNRYAASKGIYTEIGREVEYYNKRPDFFNGAYANHLDMQSGIINDRAGKYRAYRNPCVIRTIRDGIITFYAVGHKNKIQDLLSYIPAVAKKPSMGWGMVKTWEIDEIENDYTTRHPNYGIMRPITLEEEPDIEGYPIMQYGVKPPYWKPCNMRLCYVPVVK